MTDPLQAEIDGGRSSRASAISVGAAMVVAAIAAMWTIELVDTVLLSDRLQANGIVPRQRSSIDGIAYSPFLHLGWPHLIANTVPFVVLGVLVSLWGWRRWILVTLIIVVAGGGATWILARPANHIGASGVVFGYFGFLIGAVFYERRLWPIVPAGIAVFAYGSAIVGGLVPTEGVSWEGHGFGAAAGLIAAKLTSRRAGPAPEHDLP